MHHHRAHFRPVTTGFGFCLSERYTQDSAYSLRSSHHKCRRQNCLWLPTVFSGPY